VWWSDAFQRWTALQNASTDASNRLDEEVDLAFWERVARDYDSGALANRVPAVLRRVRELVPSGASLLEIGAGTGAFSLALSSTAGKVTALDYSPAMLRVLRSKLDKNPDVQNVTTLLGRWEDTDVEPHDVVLAANSLYRMRDLRCALDKLLRVARCRGIVVWSIGRQDAPQHLVREFVNPGRYRAGPDYVHLVDGLFALDVFAHVEIIEVDDTQHFTSDENAVEGLLSWQPITLEELTRGRALLPQILERNGSGWIWRRKGRIAVIWWDQPA
jgi:ubiquinone/menaquinone biosynthesis C-methylase UbiE